MTLYANQRSTWEREKHENHEYYREVLRQAELDNTPNMAYASHGRWSSLAYAMSGDQAHAIRSFLTCEQTMGKGDFATAPTFPSADSLREYGTEMVAQLMLIAPGISAEQYDAYKGWLIRNADQVLHDGCRFGDSDQLCGTHFFMVLIDKAFGTNYQAATMRDPASGGTRLVSEMRDQVTYFCDVLSEGGIWCESSDYNLNTLYVLFNGAEACGIEHYPDVVAFRDACAKAFIQSFVPDLTNTFEFGDEQTPDDAPYQLVEDVLAYLGNYYPQAIQFEKDWRAAGGSAFTKAMYHRYYLWANPYADGADWRPFVGLFLRADGVGQVIARTGWSQTDAAIWSWFQSYSRGEVDHGYFTSGDFRFWTGGAFKRDHPLAYSADVNLANQVILAGLGASVEAGELTGGLFVEGRYTYIAGVDCGSFVGPGFYDPPETVLHEKARAILWLIDRDLILVIDRIHIDDPKVLPKYGRYYADQKKIMDAAPLIQTLWHSNKSPEFVHGSIVTDDRVTPLYPCTMEPINQKTFPWTGYTHESELHWHTRVLPTVGPGFHIFATLIGDTLGAVAETIGDLHRVVISQSDRPDVVVYSSAVPSPKLSNTLSGTVTVHDPTKVNGIIQAQTITTAPPATPGADVYILQPDDLEYIPGDGTEPIPEPTPGAWTITEQSRRRIVLELQRYQRRYGGVLTTAQVRALLDRI